MKILITGSNGYIGSRLVTLLLEQGCELYCCVRNLSKVTPQNNPKIHYIEVDFLKRVTLENIPNEIDVAYYLIHSMADSGKNFSYLETLSALNFREAINSTNTKQVIYLGGIANQKDLSPHLKSRAKVEEILSEGDYSLTAIRAGIIIGKGGSSYQIIKDLVEKLPIMIAPKWLNTKTQPIALRDVLYCLSAVKGDEKFYGKSFDVGGPDVLTYKEMLYGYSKAHSLRRLIITVPVMTPRLSSYWLYFVTSTSYSLAVHLVESMKIEVLCRDMSLINMLGITPLTYEEALSEAR